MRTFTKNAAPSIHRRLPVFARGRVAQSISCAYGVHCGSALYASGPEEIAECPWTQPPGPRGFPLRPWWMV